MQRFCHSAATDALVSLLLLVVRRLASQLSYAQRMATPTATRRDAFLFAAVSGLLAGCRAGRPSTANREPRAPVVDVASDKRAADEPNPLPRERVTTSRSRPTTQGREAKSSWIYGPSKDCCKGRNECKGRGNCKTENNHCAGLNQCKWQGGCMDIDCGREPAPENPCPDTDKNECRCSYYDGPEGETSTP